jgi:ABC-type dipeptide/oligopeptide/nickel transport system permease subunit
MDADHAGDRPMSLTVYGFNLFGDAIRDILDPRLRGG